jgi:hypothetical protein
MDDLMDGSGEGIASSFHAGDPERNAALFGAKFGMDPGTAGKQLLDRYGVRAVASTAFAGYTQDRRMNDFIYGQADKGNFSYLETF